MQMDSPLERFLISPFFQTLCGRDTAGACKQQPQWISGKRFLVTGGGGSIGSELCRQIARGNPEELVALDISENGLYQLQQEIKRDYGGAFPLRIEIASIRDLKRLRQVFTKHRPAYIFHAAAHKHVPLMEENPSEAIKNNVFGTENVLIAAAESGAEKLVFISTDKAVEPSSVMGASKRLGELLIKQAHTTAFLCSAVRFGNVLGSQGSVLPLFLDQIQAGGPVIITDSRMTRFFMTIPEAAALVLRAARQTNGGELFVLDMGKPVSILRLAEELIRFCGKEPYSEIPLVFSGLRPGEKLEESLMTAAQQKKAILEDGIWKVPMNEFDEDEMEHALNRLRHVLDKEPDEIRHVLFTAVSGLTE